MPPKRDWPETYDRTLEDLHALGLGDYDVAGRMNDMGHPVSSNEVSIARRRLGLPTNKRPVHNTAVDRGGIPAPPVKANPVTVAACTLGARLEERESGFWLDRLPASLDTVMRETNRVRVANGCEQIGHSEKWLVS